MRWATRTPIRPRPTTPIVLSVISTPVNLLRFHSPVLRLELACGTRRATASNNATACSAAETMLEVGALTTSTPRAVAAGTSTLSSPTPARATTLSRSAAASASASTCVALRTMIASTPASAGSSAARSAPSTVLTSKSPASTSRALGASSSATRTTGRDTRPRLPGDLRDRPLEPGDVPPLAELAADLMERADLGEAEPQVQRDRRVVGQRHTGIRVVRVLVLQRLEPGGIDRRADPPAGGPGGAVDRGLDRGVICGLVAEPAAGRIAENFSRRRLRDEQA